MRNQLARDISFAHEVLLNEVNHVSSMPLVLVLEIKAFRHFLNVDRLKVGVVLQNQLFKVEHGSLMSHSLSQLNLRLPSMGRPHLLAVVTLPIVDFEF
jgi:hypothetical protein